jgi:hypothetical protein
VALHPGAVAGTNELVVGAAKMRDADGDCAPSERGTAIVHVKVVVSALVPSLDTPITRKVAEGGRVRQADGVVTSPRSIDQSPPGVRG